MALVVLSGMAADLRAQTITFTELNYHSDSVRDSGDWLELYNFGADPVLLTGWYLRDGNPDNRWNLPSGTTIQPGAHLVISNQLARFSTVYPDVDNAIGQPDFGFSNSGESIALFNASNALVASMAYTDSMPWQKGADGLGRTLEVINPLGDLSDPFNWFDGCMYGSPGRAYTPCDPALVISEINYNSGPAADPGDWIELHNRSSAAFNLSNFVLRNRSDTSQFVLPPGTSIPPGGYLVLARDLARFASVHPDVNPVLGSFDFNLDGGGDRIRFFEPSGAIYWHVVYRDEVPWPVAADGGGYTLELLDASGPMNRASNWFDGCPLGSPGGPFEPWCWTAGEEESAPEPAWPWGLQAAGLWVECPAGFSGELYLLDVSGRVLTSQRALGGGMVQLPMQALPAGIYFFAAFSQSGLRPFSTRLFWSGSLR